MKLHYRYPKLYDFLISFLYSKKLLKKLAEEVGKKKSIFDIAAGYGRLAKFIDPSNNYYGIDVNRHFIEYGRNQGINLEVKNIFDPRAYKVKDVFLAVDIVHHLSKNTLKRLFNMVFKYAKEKVIVIEPAFVNLSSRYGFFGKVCDWIFRKIDDDGFNKITRWFSAKEYRELFASAFNSKYGKDFLLRYERVGRHYLAVFTKRSATAAA